ncbi:hypothetical protein Tco_0066209 [Tanacetum coccineum]
MNSSLTDAKSGSVDGGFIDSVVGGGVGVNNSGGGVKDCNDFGMTVENIGEESEITETGTVRSVGVCWLDAKSDEREELETGTLVFCGSVESVT